ncbi:MAG TPA: DUF1843 domain-containing protein [Longimicrobium sp.]|nr:DUF1843 domain-containing protein [Longimicrobium sp.]
MSDQRPPIRPLYAAAIQEARDSGDRDAMQALADRAASEGSSDPEIQSALTDLRASMKDQPMQAMYGVALNQALRSGDVSQMRALADRAEKEGADDPEIQSALADVRTELSRRGS